MKSIHIDLTDIPASIASDKALAAELLNLKKAEELLAEAEGQEYTFQQFEARQLAAQLAKWNAVAAYAAAKAADTVLSINRRIAE
jgi:DNA-directed RNA polymerase subunit F